MQVPADRTDSSSLEALARQATQLLRAGRFTALAESFGYAVALGRERASAIEADLQVVLNALGAIRVAEHEQVRTEVKYFEPGSTLHALVECTLLANNGRSLLVELVVTKQEGHAHVMLEQISAAA